jgi:transcriptional antiterminator RfaH
MALMGYWACARLEPHRERLALHCLGLAGFVTYLPRLREWRRSHGRKIETRPPLFPGYAFIAIELQWHAARWTAGVLGIIMDGVRPARVADRIIDDLRQRERDGLIELAPPPKFRSGDPVRVTAGPFVGHLGLYAGMKPRERVEILLQLLGAEQRVELSANDIEAAPG